MKQPFRVIDPQQIAVISAPGRDEIVDMIGVIGPCTATELSRAMGRSRHALYYHLRALAKCGLLIETTVKGKRRAASRYEVVGRPLVVHFDLRTPRSRRAVLALANSRLRSARRGFDRACRPDVAVVDGRRRNLWATHWKGWLSAAELEEVNLCFARLIEAMNPTPGTRADDRKCYELTFAFVPSVPQPAYAGPQPGKSPKRSGRARARPA